MYIPNTHVILNAIMKKFYYNLFFVALIAYNNKSFAQYQSLFGINNVSWKIVTSNLWGYGTDSLRIGSDTLINGLQYKQIISDNIIYNPQHIHGFLREDTNTGQAWYKGYYSLSPPQGDSTERLIMNMSLAVGDSFYIAPYPPFPLDTGWLIVDSVFYLYGRKHVQFMDSTASYWGGKLKFIEGIGPNLGIQYLSENLNTNPYLLCSYKDNMEIYSNNNPHFNGCNLIAAILQNNSYGKQKIKIFPIPASDEITMDLNLYSNYTQLSIYLFDGMGKKIRKIIPKFPNTAINTKDINEGIYFINISNNDILLQTTKIVIIKTQNK